MNFGRQNIEIEADRLESHAGALGNKARSYAAKGIFVLFIAIVIIGFSGVYGVVQGILADTPSVSSVNIAPSGYATLVYDASGNEIQKLVAPDANRMAVSIDRVPQYLQDAAVAGEDERFYKHNGIDPYGMVRALVTMIQTRFQSTQGASTITQQLLKNNVFTTWTQEKTWTSRIKRKLQEQFLALELEKQLQNKKLILENYLNTINLGAGTYGVEAAARKYFNKDVWDLNLSECVTISVITQNPSKYNPIRHPDKNAERRLRILDKMEELGFITAEEKAEALADDPYTRIMEAQEAEQAESTVYSYFTDELTEEIVSDLVEQKGYTRKQAYHFLYNGGLRIFTTQDQKIQKICDEEFLNEANYPNATEYGLDWALSTTNAEGEVTNYSREMLRKYFRENGRPNFSLTFKTPEDCQAAVDAYKQAILSPDEVIIGERFAAVPEPQASIVVIDQGTGYVKGIVGGRGEKTASLTLNRATTTTRQPGSTMKILSTYAPALDRGKITLATIYKDEPYNYNNGQPVNEWLMDHYVGNVTVREAIINSLNVPAVKCITSITPRVGYEQCIKFGITTLDEKNDVYQPLALGGITNGVTVLEMTAAYAALANEGIYTKPIFYTRVLDQYGNTILDNTPEQSRAVKASTAFLLTDAMRSVVTKGTAKDCALGSMPVAGKTGTTSDYHDTWFIGYTPYYTCGVWTGYDDNTPLPDEGTYHTFYKTLWTAVMSRIHEDLTPREFSRPADIGVATVCESTGMLSTFTCLKPITEYFSLDTIPSKECVKHYGMVYDMDDYSYFHEYGYGGNSMSPGAYALGVDDLYRFTIEDGEAAFARYQETYNQQVKDEEAEKRRKEEEERRKKEEEERRKREEERRRSESEAAERSRQEEEERRRSESEAAANSSSDSSST